jgi:protein-tyrosine phosphatase
VLQPTLYWIEEAAPRRLAIVSRPRGDEDLADELKALAAAGVNTVVSLLEPSEVRDLGLRLEQMQCEANGLAFISFAIPDRGIPKPAPFVSLMRMVDRQLVSGAAVAVHCRAGIGRSGLVAAGLLVAQGRSPAEAFTAVSNARGVRVPDTPDQEAWLHRQAQSLRSAALKA